MDKPYDTKALMALIIDDIKQETGIDCFVADSVGPQQKYPFFTFDFVDPHINLPFTDNVDFEQFEMAIHFDAHAKSIYTATDLANQLTKLFKTQAFSLLAEQNNFYVIDSDSVESTDNVISIQVEYRAGFELHLRICDSFQDDIQTIDSVDINGTSLSAKNTQEKG